MSEIRIVSMKLPIREIGNAVEAVRKAHDKLLALERERAALGTVEAVRQRMGEDGVKRRAVALEALEERWPLIVADAQAAVEEQARAAVEAIDKQVTPSGADILGENAADFALIEHGLISTPAQLARILAKHDNVAFRIAASRYAADPSRMWEGFSFLDKENSVREFTKQAFSNLKIAASVPHGPAFMQYADTPREYSRIALAYDLADEYAASGGDALEDMYD